MSHLAPSLYSSRASNKLSLPTTEREEKEGRWYRYVDVPPPPPPPLIRLLLLLLPLPLLFEVGERSGKSQIGRSE